MSPQATSRKTASRPKSGRGAVARSEVNGKVKQVLFRGVRLKVPATCPGAVLFDISDDNISATLRTLLGNDQYLRVRDKVADDGLSLTETATELTEFLNGLFSDTYGITAGE